MANKISKNGTPLFMWIKKIQDRNGNEIQNSHKIMFRFRIYEKIEDRGNMSCYKLKQ